ncbi:MAG: deoxyribose-phosphate aldolase [Lachnospiraceae bacterium]|jgi:deoxyribose-phosphate aldolase|nr:deoxyribose-phosphate aldolase [Lachnospiraceae bacterium]
MNQQELMKHIDHTLLKADCTWDGIVRLCDESIEFQTASVCIPPTYVKRVHDTYGDEINICTVIGFPLGYSVTEAKVAETEQAVHDGANEIDMVINITDVKNGLFDKVKNEISLVKGACDGHILKVIIETCYLTDDEKKMMCTIVTEAGADFIKTSTGFGSAGATMADVKLMKANIGPGVKIKAAGGITTLEEIEQYIEAGCERIGTSRAIGLYKEKISGE